MPKTPSLPIIPRDISALEVIYRTGGISRYDLGNRLGLNQTVIIRMVAQLIQAGLLTSEIQSNKQRGRPIEQIKVAPQSRYSVGLEFGREHLVVVILNALGQVHYSKTWPNPPAFKADAKTLDSLIELAKKTMSEAKLPWTKVCAVGLALHDIVSAQGLWSTRESAPLHAVNTLQAKLGFTITAEDVSRSFAVAEQRFGTAKHQPDMLYVFVGRDGVGSGIFVNGELLKSSSGVCGEVGHVVVVPDGAQCHCGSRGCLETEATHQAVIKAFQALSVQGVRSKVKDLSFRSICEGAAMGDKAAYLVLSRLATFLAEALATAINISGANHVVIGGQLHLAGGKFLQDIEVVLRKRVVSPLLNQLSVQYASLAPYAGAWGAGVLALEAAIKNGSFMNEHKPIKLLEKTARPVLER